LQSSAPTFDELVLGYLEDESERLSEAAVA
jgi:hypothetical protein